MAAKRFDDESGTDSDKPSEKRMKTTRPSFAAVVGEAVRVNTLKNSFCLALEPLIRRVVNEEVEEGLKRGARYLLRAPSFRIQAPEPSNFQLVFKKKLLLPIFTGSKIVDVENNPLQVLLVDTTNHGGQMVPTTLPYPIRVELVVLDGDFPPAGCDDTWTSEELNGNIVKERTGRRPLLTGELAVTMRDGIITVGEIEFTDNSSWIRSRKFRIGARLAPGSSHGISIREAVTEAFKVKDHRGELYKKHHPPMLDDEVWRLEKIGKDGAFHKKLASKGINTVQDFLKMSVVDPNKLRKTLGVGMSEKMWEVTIKHAKTCVLGTKHYVLRPSPHTTIFLNPIGQVIKAIINGQLFSSRDLIHFLNRGYVENLVKEAYENWNSLEEVDGILNETPLITQGEIVEQYPNYDHQNQAMVKSHQQQGLLTDKSMGGGGYLLNNDQVGSSNWVVMNSTYPATPIEGGFSYYLPESTSDGDLK